MRRLIAPLLILTVPLGLTFLLTSTLPAVAEPVSVTPLPSVAETDGYGGVSWSFYYDPPEGPDRPFIQMAYDAGSRWDRFDFTWPVIEPRNDNWEWEPHDAVVDDLEAAGVNMIGILLWTPDWAATQGVMGLEALSLNERPLGWYAPVPRGSVAATDTSAFSSPPQGLHLPWDDPNNHWGNFVYTVVSRYGNRVKYWEMWNEPDGNWGTWTGSDADYAQLLKVGYQAAKEANPDAQVLFGGLMYWSDPTFFERILDIVDDDTEAPDNNYFFDVMSVHFYSRSSNAYDMVNHVRSRMATYVPDHPIWLTETGVPVWGDPQVSYRPKYDYAATQEEAAAYVIQSYANARASGVERYIFFRIHDENMSEYFGMIHNDHSLRPAYVANQVATAYLISPTFTTRVPTSAHMRVTLWGSPRGKVSVLWNKSPTASVYTLPAALPTATLVDRLGTTQTVAATGGIYTFTLPGATANLVSDSDDYFIGGDPLIVIESEAANEPPTSTINPLPAQVHSSTFTLTWEGQDNESGVWLYDVQVRDGESGAWDDWLQLTPLTSSQFTVQHGHTYYFRSRALDNVGNREPWADQPQAHTTADLSSSFHFSVGTFFADEDRDDTWDSITTTGEITLTGVTLRFLDGDGQNVISPTVSGAFTATVYAGQPYRVLAMSADHMRLLSFTPPLGGEVYTETHPTLGLWPMSRNYLPLILRDE